MENEVIRQLMERKSVRSYENRPIEEEKKRSILEAAIQAPTAGNMMLYRILDVTDQKIKDLLAVTCDHQPFIARAPMVLIFCADYQEWYDIFVEKLNPERRPAQSDFLLATADAYIAAQNAVTAAWSLGIGSCYIGDILENYEIHQSLFALPRYMVPVGMVCFGYPTSQQISRSKPKRFSVDDMVMENQYKQQDFEKMLAELEGKPKDEMEEWLAAFCERKWDAPFSQEMERSVKKMLENWE